MNNATSKTTYTIPNKSMRIVRFTNLVIGLVFVGIAVATFSNDKFISGIFGICGLIALARVFTLPFEYRKKR